MRSEKFLEKEEYGVVVVGGGGAGLAAAIEAAAAGARVVLVEKCEKLGGTTSLSVGSITATGTPHQRRHGIVNDTPVEHAEDLAKMRELAKEAIEVGALGFASSRFQHNSSFENVDRRDASPFGCGYHVQELLSLWLRQENGK